MAAFLWLKMHKDDVIYKTPEGFDLISYMDNIADELKRGLSLFKSSEKKVVVFGSAREKENDKYYKMSVELGKELVSKGYAVVTGGGPGIMEAALKGAYENNGTTYGINIILPHEQHNNQFVEYSFLCDHLFTRKVLLVRNMSAYFVMPGGFGTLDELFEVLTLIATNIQNHVPVILVGKDFWSGLLSWIKEQLLLNHKYINYDEFNMLKLADNIEEAVSYLD